MIPYWSEPTVGSTATAAVRDAIPHQKARKSRPSWYPHGSARLRSPAPPGKAPYFPSPTTFVAEKMRKTKRAQELRRVQSQRGVRGEHDRKKRTSASRARSESRSRSRAGTVRARTAARGCKSARQVSAPVSPPAADPISPRCRRARASVTTLCKISTFFWTSYCSNNLFVLVLCLFPSRNGRMEGKRRWRAPGGRGG